MRDKPRGYGVTVLRRWALVSAAGVLAGGPLLAACSTAADDPPSTAASSSASAPVASPGALSSSAAEGLPEGWPSGLPYYQDGRPLSVVISEDGLNVNAAWASEQTADDAWAAMDAALRDRGFVLSSEAGGEDMLVQDATMRSDYYLREGFEVNLVVLPGEETTVLVNASQL